MAGNIFNYDTILGDYDMGVIMINYVTYAVWESSEIVLVNDKISTIIGSVKYACLLCYNLHKSLPVNMTINNAQNLSILMVNMFIIKVNNINDFQDL